MLLPFLTLVPHYRTQYTFDVYLNIRRNPYTHTHTHKRIRRHTNKQTGRQNETLERWTRKNERTSAECTPYPSIRICFGTRSAFSLRENVNTHTHTRIRIEDPLFIRRAECIVSVGVVCEWALWLFFLYFIYDAFSVFSPLFVAGFWMLKRFLFLFKRSFSILAEAIRSFFRLLCVLFGFGLIS